MTTYLYHERYPVEVRNNMILRGDGKVPAICHQYDRQKSLTELVGKIYREQNFIPNENFNDIHSMADQILYLVNIQRWTDATKLFVNYLSETDLTEYRSVIFKIYETVFKNINQLSLEVEIFILVIQKAIISACSAGMEINQAEYIYSTFCMLKKNSVAVGKQFENFVGGMLMNFMNIFYQNKRNDLCVMYFERLAEIDFPLEKDFYIFQAKVYRETGNKEKALESYKKFLDMS